MILECEPALALRLASDANLYEPASILGLQCSHLESTDSNAHPHKRVAVRIN